MLNDFDLVRLVESYPILYDKRMSRGQKNAAMKDKAWNDVSQKLNASERACITRWKSIRDRFGKEYRRVQENPEEPTSTWEIFPHLLFLKDHYKHGQASSDSLGEVKIGPKARSRGRSRAVIDTSQAEEESNNEDDSSIDDMILSQQLIALVKSHSVLYDKHKIRDSKNLTAKNDAWRDISENLGLSEECCYKRWKKMRDRFAREYRYQKLCPDKPVLWAYFHDLMFLEDHYRKGIPLRVENLKRRPACLTENVIVNTINSSSTVDDPWGSDYPYECLKDDQSMPETVEEYGEDIQTQSLDELIIIPAKKPKSEHSLDEEDEEVVTETVAACTKVPETNMTVTTITMDTCTDSETRLGNVIANMETVLHETRACLKSVQLQKQALMQRQELDSNLWQSHSGLIQKVHMLLDGLNPVHRNKAERKILQFLCECQIKSLNNEEIEDVCSVHIY